LGPRRSQKKGNIRTQSLKGITYLYQPKRVRIGRNLIPSGNPVIQTLKVRNTFLGMVLRTSPNKNARIRIPNS